ncbi:MAG: hypothetical protein HOP23_18855 [Methylococcaceae bacterium]|nr:hypothetical protein [Methylococcaceae bacterium]
MRLIPVSTGRLAVGGDLDVLPDLAVLGAFPILALAWAALLGLNDGGINDADFAGLDIQPFGR